MIHHLRVFAAKIRGLFADRRSDEELNDEIRTHLELLTERYVGQGMSEEEARRAARRQFGNVLLLREKTRDVRRFGAVDILLQDLRYGARMLIRNKAFSAVAVITLALGIGANTAIFSVVHAVLLESLPYPDPDRLVAVWETRKTDPRGQNVINLANFIDWKEQNGVFEEMAAYFYRNVNLTGSGEPEEIRAQVDQPNRRGRGPMAVARLKQGVTLEQAQAEMRAIHGRIEQQYSEFNSGWTVSLVPLREQLAGEIRPALMVLLGAVVMVLLIACANVANLMLARAAGRQREVAVRASLGASRGRIIRQLLTESLLLAGLGGLCGLALAWWGVGMLVSLAPSDLLNLPQVEINAPVLGFTLGISLLVGIIFGLVPAIEATRLNLSEALKDGGRSGGGGRRAERLRSSLVIVEVAMAVVLLAGAGLLIRSFTRLQGVDPGFNAQNVLTMPLTLSGSKYDTEEKRIDFFRRAIEGMEALAGVEAAGAVNSLPFAAPHSGTSVDIEGRPIVPVTQKLKTGVMVTDANYFRAMQIPLKRGRLFSDREAAEMRHVVVINEAFARSHFPGEEPLGKRVTIFMKNDNQPCEIIGIVGDSKHMNLDGAVRPMAYWPHPELPGGSMTFVIRTSGDAAAITAAARNVIRALDPDQPVAEVRTMESLIGGSLARARFNTLLLAIFAVVALLLAAVGIYGVMAYRVAQRTHEIGIRLALGARAADVVRQVVGSGMALVLGGMAIGVVASLAMTRLMTSLLYDVSATDPLTFVAIPVVLALVSLMACLFPARRAAKVDPMIALRYE